MTKAIPLEVTAETKDLACKLADAFAEGLDDVQVFSRFFQRVDKLEYIAVVRYLMYLMDHEFPRPQTEITEAAAHTHTDSGDYTYPPGSA